jgi:hypothetical protein
MATRLLLFIPNLFKALADLPDALFPKGGNVLSTGGI